MTTIKMRCADCAHLAVGPAGAFLVDTVENGPGRGFTATVWWICAGCSDLVSTRVGWLRMRRLRMAGGPTFAGTGTLAVSRLAPSPEPTGSDTYREFPGRYASWPPLPWLFYPPWAP